MSQLYTDKYGAIVTKRCGTAYTEESLIASRDAELTRDMMANLNIGHEYQVRQTVKTWYATLHIAGNIDVAEAFLQKKILNEGACFQIAPCNYVYSGGCEKGMTIRVIHYPRFPENGPDKLLKRLEKYASLLAVELGQKSFTIETSDNTFFYDNGNKHG